MDKIIGQNVKYSIDEKGVVFVNYILDNGGTTFLMRVSLLLIFEYYVKHIIIAGKNKLELLSTRCCRRRLIQLTINCIYSL